MSHTTPLESTRSDVGPLASGGDVLPPVERNGSVVNSGLTTDELAERIIALGAQFPPPDEKAILADCRWLQEHWIDENLSPYRGTHVAVFNGEVVGSGDNSLQLELDLARKLNVHPQRLIINYIPRVGDF